MFVCSLCIWTEYVSVKPNFPGILLSSRCRSRAIFSPESYKSFPSPPPPSVSNQWNCSIPFSKRGQVTKGFRGCWVRIYGPFSWNPIGWLWTNRNSVSEKSLNLNWIVVETVLDGFLEAASSNLMSICLEIRWVQLEPISDNKYVRFERLCFLFQKKSAQARVDFADIEDDWSERFFSEDLVECNEVSGWANLSVDFFLRWKDDEEEQDEWEMKLIRHLSDALIAFYVELIKQYCASSSLLPTCTGGSEASTFAEGSAIAQSSTRF